MKNQESKNDNNELIAVEIILNLPRQKNYCETVEQQVECSTEEREKKPTECEIEFEKLFAYIIEKSKFCKEFMDLHNNEGEKDSAEFYRGQWIVYLELAQKIGKLENAYISECGAFDILAHDRDYYKSQAEALERAVKSKTHGCGYCIHAKQCKNRWYVIPKCCDCWQFDYERFSEGGGQDAE
jgi:hypothetical protein